MVVLIWLIWWFMMIHIWKVGLRAVPVGRISHPLVAKPEQVVGRHTTGVSLAQMALDRGTVLDRLSFRIFHNHESSLTIYINHRLPSLTSVIIISHHSPSFTNPCRIFRRWSVPLQKKNAIAEGQKVVESSCENRGSHGTALDMQLWASRWNTSENLWGKIWEINE